MGTGVIGREQELAEVGRFLDRLRDGFAVLVLEGEPGIGKTTVWREARVRAQERGWLVVSCRASPAEAKFSYSAISDLVSPLLGEDPLGNLPEPQRDALEVALLRRRSTRRGLDRRAVAAGFLSLLRQLASTRQLVVAVDDWQWLDLPSRRVLEFAARRLESEPVGLLCSVRSPAVDETLAGAVSEDRPRKVVLSALSLAALGRILAERLGRVFPRPLLARIAQASRGNPLYALEIARLIVDRGEAQRGWSELPVPKDLRTLIAARIQRLPADVREAVLLAAVLSSPDRASVGVEALAQAEEAGIVTVDDAGNVDFTHPLFASAAYGSAPAARRRELHRRAAELVSDPEQRARHLALGSTQPDAAVARQLDEAAARATSRGAPDAAAELAELAATHTPAADSTARTERLLAAARSHVDAGDLARAEALAHDVLAASPPDWLGARTLQLGAQLAGRRSNYTEAAGLAAAALEVAGEDQRLRAEIELELVYCSAGLGNLRGAAEQARAAVDHAEAAGDKGLLAEALAAATISRFLCGDGLDQQALARALKLEDPARVQTLPVNPRYIHGNLQLWSGQLDGALETHMRLRNELVDRGQEGFVPLLLLYLVQTCVWMGDLPRAAHFAAEAGETAALLEDPTATAIGLGAGALVHAHDGRSELARREALEALALFERLQWRPGAIWPMWALGLVELSEGNPAGVDGVLGPLTEQLLQMDGGDPCLFVFLPDEIEALAALGELDRAEAYLQPFERRARDLDRAWALAAAARCRGVLAAARGESEPAFKAFERALAEHARIEMPFERARTLLVAGQAYRRFKQRGRGRAALSEALEVFEQVGAPLWADRARTELARVGRPGAGGDELTETERRLAEFAASGLSNRQVAERAFVSVKTVEANLTRVYRKLGVRSRVALANALRAGDAEHEPPQA